MQSNLMSLKIPDNEIETSARSCGGLVAMPLQGLDVDGDIRPGEDSPSYTSEQ